MCPALCDPVCAPAECHTTCEEPQGALCEVKCEQPQCEIKCPGVGCSDTECPECQAICTAPHCITVCEPPAPKCQVICKEPACDWKCYKPTDCPKPQCELICENPQCRPDISCCPCHGKDSLHLTIPLFKVDEPNPGCCEC